MVTLAQGGRAYGIGFLRGGRYPGGDWLSLSLFSRFSFEGEGVCIDIGILSMNRMDGFGYCWFLLM